jgi:hypothetical protein
MLLLLLLLLMLLLLMLLLLLLLLILLLTILLHSIRESGPSSLRWLRGASPSCASSGRATH